MERLLKRSLIRSLVLAGAVAISAYLLIWGMEVTHPELAIPSGASLTVAVWAFPIVFIGNLVISAVKDAAARRH